MRLSSKFFSALALLSAAGWGLAPAAAVERDFAIYGDPKLETAGETLAVPSNLTRLWLEALARPEVDLKRQSAEAFAKAYGLGLRELDGVTPLLLKELQAENQHPVVLLAVARTLVVIEARDTAAALAEQAERGGLDLAQAIEPALAAWNYKPQRKVWLDRLALPESVSHARLILAIDALGTVQEPAAVEPLRKLVLDNQASPDLRLHAAQALAQIKTEGLLADAQKLAQSQDSAHLVDRLVAASLLTQHTGKETEALLLHLAVDPEPAVAAIALERLLAIDPALVEPINEKLVSSSDSKVRRLAAELLKGQQTVAAVKLLGKLLSDPHPGVRSYTCDALVELAKQKALDKTVRAMGMQTLSGAPAYGMEQALLLMGALDHEPAAPRAVELLTHPEPRVFITAAWTLRKLAVPDTAPAMLKRVQTETEASLARGAKKETIDYQAFADLGQQLQHLIEGLGVMDHKPALPLFAKYLPKPKLILDPELVPQETTREANLRAAVIWSLGHMYRDRPDEKLVARLQERMTDENLSDPESDLVRQMSAVSLARMNAQSAVKALKRYTASPDSPGTFFLACHWALSQLTGEPMPKFEPREVQQFGWFLEPLK